MAPRWLIMGRSPSRGGPGGCYRHGRASPEERAQVGAGGIQHRLAKGQPAGAVPDEGREDIALAQRKAHRDA